MTLIERVYWIDGEIRAGRFPNADAVAERFEVSRRTAFKDRDHLLNRLNAPLIWDRSRSGWTYSDFTWVLPFLALSEAEAATLRRSLLAAQEYLTPADGRIAGQLFARLLPDLARPGSWETGGGAIHLLPTRRYAAKPPGSCRHDSEYKTSRLTGEAERRSLKSPYRAAGCEWALRTCMFCLYHNKAIEGGDHPDGGE